MSFVNIWGRPIDMSVWHRAQAAQSRRKDDEKRRPTVKRGYAGVPGTGPKGETCKGCAHKKSFGGASTGTKKTFIKCELRRSTWTNGEGTDILARSPACNKFEPLQKDGAK